MKRFLPSSLRAKIILVLVLVTIPTFAVGTYLLNRIILPVLEQDVKERGISSARALAGEIAAGDLLEPSGREELEQQIEEMLYLHPSIVRIDVLKRDLTTKKVHAVASNYEISTTNPEPSFQFVDTIVSRLSGDRASGRYWEIHVPVRRKTLKAGTGKVVQGNVRLLISLKPATAILASLWEVNFIGALVIVAVLIIALTHFLRRAIESDKLLKLATSQNVKLTEQLQNVEEQLTGKVPITNLQISPRRAF